MTIQLIYLFVKNQELMIRYFRVYRLTNLVSLILRNLNHQQLHLFVISYNGVFLFRIGSLEVLCQRFNVVLFVLHGVRILEDTSVLLPCGVRVVGRKDYLYTNGSRFTAAQLMPGGPDDHYTVWLDHEPRDFKNAAAAGADLILSGHTHGGQVWPAGAVGMVAKNERNYGRKHIADHCDAIVSGGTGTWGYKFRTQGRTEIVCAEITTEREN